MKFFEVSVTVVLVACLAVQGAVIYDSEYGGWLGDRQSSTSGGSFGSTFGNALGGAVVHLPVVGSSLQGPVSNLVGGATSGLLGALTNGAFTRVFFL